MALPTFLILGGQKCGSTSLYRYLEQHPDVFMSSPKEPGFFNPDGFAADVDHPSSRLDGYEALFAQGAGHRARGEATAAYLWSHDAPTNAAALIPDARLIAILRDPIARAYSAWLHLRRRGWEPIDDFLDAVDAEAARTAAGGHRQLTRYVEAGRYHEQLRRWLDAFDAEQLQVHLTEDLESDPLRVVAQCFGHVGAAEGFTPDLGVRHNEGGVPRSRHFVRWLESWGHERSTWRLSRIVRAVVPTSARQRVRRSISASNLRPAPPLSCDVYERLAPRFADDVRALRSLLGRDLAEWPITRLIDR